MKPSASSADLRLGAKPPSSPTIGAVAGVCETLAQGVEDLRAHADGIGAGVGPHRHDHELLDVDGVVGMRPAIDDVHHGHGQQVGVAAAEIAIERSLERFRRRLGHGQRYAEDGIGAEPGLVGRAVELDQRVVDAALVLGVHSGERIEDLAVDGIDGLEHAFAEVAPLVAVAQLDGFVRAGGGADRHRGAPPRPVLEDDIDLDRGIAAAVQDLAADDVDDGGHELSPANALRPWGRPWEGFGAGSSLCARWLAKRQIARSVGCR